MNAAQSSSLEIGKYSLDTAGRKSVKESVSKIFAREDKIIIDTSVIPIISKRVPKEAFFYEHFKEATLDASIAFLEELNANIPLHHNQIFIFPELCAEYKTTLDILEQIQQKAMRGIREKQIAHADLLCDKMERYCRKIRRFKHLSKRYCKNAEFDYIAEKFKNLLLYLNQRFEWKDEDSKIKTDEKIIAYAVISSMLGSPTTIYTNDKGILSLTTEAISFLTSDEIKESEFISPSAKDFTDQLRNADTRVRMYDASANDFAICLDNLEDIQTNTKHGWFPKRLKSNTRPILCRTSEHITDIINSMNYK